MRDSSVTVGGIAGPDSTSGGGASGNTDTVGSLGVGAGDVTAGGGVVRTAVARSMIGAGRLVGASGAQDNAAAATKAAATTRPSNLATRGAVFDASLETRMSEEVLPPDATDARESTSGSRAAPGSLYVVATPLGHARDLTLHAHNETRRAASLVAALADNKSVAIVSDAGTPAISDPGARLVRAAHDAGYAVVPIPGPSAVAAAVSGAGLDAERFVFIGFLPPKAKARRELLASVASLPFALVFYEAPHRVRETVAELANMLGARTLFVARELTKVFETLTRIRLDDAVAWLDADSNRTRGEFVLIVDAATDVQQPTATLPRDVERWLAALL